MSDDLLTLSQIAAMPDDSNWVALLRERIAALCFAHGEAALAPVARTVFLADRVVTNTLSGGLQNLVPPWAGIDEARAIRDALVTIEAARMAEVSAARASWRRPRRQTSGKTSRARRASRWTD